MASTEAQKRAVVNYMRRMDSITLRPSKERGAAVRAAAKAAGKPLQVYIMEAAEEKMNKEKAGD